MGRSSGGREQPRAFGRSLTNCWWPAKAPPRRPLRPMLAALDDAVLRQHQRDGPLHGVVEGEGVEAGRLLGALRRRHRRAAALALRRAAARLGGVDDAQQLLGQVVRQQVARERVLELVGRRHRPQRELQLRVEPAARDVRHGLDLRGGQHTAERASGGQQPQAFGGQAWMSCWCGQPHAAAKTALLTAAA